MKKWTDSLKEPLSRDYERRVLQAAESELKTLRKRSLHGRWAFLASLAVASFAGLMWWKNQTDDLLDEPLNELLGEHSGENFGKEFNDEIPDPELLGDLDLLEDLSPEDFELLENWDERTDG